jgi:hypothetical protein
MELKLDEHSGGLSLSGIETLSFTRDLSRFVG